MRTKKIATLDHDEDNKSKAIARETRGYGGGRKEI